VQKLFTIQPYNEVVTIELTYFVSSEARKVAAFPLPVMIDSKLVRYFRNLSNIDDRVRNISWQTLNLTQTLTLTLTLTLTIYIHIHIHGHLC